MAPTPPESPDQGPEHNPDNLSPEQYGAPEWRLLREGEDPENGDETWRRKAGGWLGLANGFEPGMREFFTYRRRVNKLAYEQSGEPRTTQGQRIAELERELWLTRRNAKTNDDVSAAVMETLRATIETLTRERDGARAEAGAIRDLVETLLKEAETAINDRDERQHLSLAQWEGRKSVLVGMSAILPTAGADLLKELEFVRKGRKTALAQLEKDREALETAAQGLRDALGVLMNWAQWQIDLPPMRAEIVRTELARFDALKEGK